MRYARSCACMSCEGFQFGSKTTTTVAETRLIPRPPAFVERRKRNFCEAVVELNSSTSAAKRQKLVDPSRRRWEYLGEGRRAVRELRRIAQNCAELRRVREARHEVLEDVEHLRRVREEEDLRARRAGRETGRREAHAKGEARRRREGARAFCCFLCHMRSSTLRVCIFPQCESDA